MPHTYPAMEPWEPQDDAARTPHPRWIDAGLLAVALTILAAGAAAIFLLPQLDARQSCMSPLNRDAVIEGDQSGKTVTIPQGSIFSVRLGGFGALSYYSRSSNPSVLRALPLCPDPRVVSSAPLTIMAYRAVTPGTADVLAFPSRLGSGPSDPSPPANTASFRVRVIVPAFDVMPWLKLTALMVIAAALIAWFVTSGRDRLIQTRSPSAA